MNTNSLTNLSPIRWRFKGEAWCLGTFGQFSAENSDEPSLIADIERELSAGRRYYGGGGAAPEFCVESVRLLKWHASRSSGAGQGLVIDEDTGRNVAVVYEYEDAALLAAAPDLLAALQAILPHVSDSVLAQFPEVHAAIQAATGDAIRREQEAGAKPEPCTIQAKIGGKWRDVPGTRFN